MSPHFLKISVKSSLWLNLKKCSLGGKIWTPGVILVSSIVCLYAWQSKFAKYIIDYGVRLKNQVKIAQYG